MTEASRMFQSSSQYAPLHHSCLNQYRVCGPLQAYLGYIGVFVPVLLVLLVRSSAIVCILLSWLGVLTLAHAFGGVTDPPLLGRSSSLVPRCSPASSPQLIFSIYIGTLLGRLVWPNRLVCDIMVMAQTKACV